MPLDQETRDRITSLINDNEVVLFMKGDRRFPQCGFSSTVVNIINTMITEYTTVDVLSDQTIREGIKEFSQWPTIPQLYVKGEFLGGCDIVQEIFQSGELQEKLGIDTKNVEPPSFTVTEKAAEKIREAMEKQGPEGDIHMSVDASFQTSFFKGPSGDNDFKVETGGITLFIDRLSAGRANGSTIDFVETPEGSGIKIDNPNAPK